ncbi:MAG TPA: hypothetical protein VGO35_11665 [Gammaproteobacteria bacterium]|nr:hypothetical protein [Gammaproteobacteria bacterium]
MNNVDEEIEREAARLWGEHRSIRGRFNYWANRAYIRLLRICGGWLLIYVAYGYRGRLIALVHTSISALSIADLGAIIGYGLCGLAAVVGALWLAFGSAIERGPASPSDFHNRARAVITERTRIAKFNANYPLLGRLRSPSLGFKNRWKASLLRALVSLVLFLLSVALGAHLLNLPLWQLDPAIAFTLIIFGVVVMLPIFVIYMVRTLFDFATRQREA